MPGSVRCERVAFTVERGRNFTTATVAAGCPLGVASALFQQQLEQAGTKCSMSEKGECLDNAVAESFFGTYKAELLADQPQGQFTSKAQARALTADYIEKFYNTVRLHSTLDYKSPVAFELAHRRKEVEYNMLLTSCPR